MEERLQKILSAAGVCSRRAAEGYLEAGRITVNGQVAQLGQKADPQVDTIAVDGVALGTKPTLTYIMLHKPRGYVTTLDDEQGRRTVAELVADCGVRLWPVGRLDMDSEGLLLMSNDGDLTHKLIHPSHEVEKEYHVRVEGDVTAGLPILQGRLTLDDEVLHPAKVVRTGNQTLSITIHQGKKRQVRRMCELAGLAVLRLRRVREGDLQLGDLHPRQWRHLTEEEVTALQRL